MKHDMKLATQWFDLIKNGSKTIEGRVNDHKRQSVNVGDVIVFTNPMGEKIITKVSAKKEFKNFDKAIRYAKLKNILPGIKTYKEGVSLYHSIPGYKEGAKKYGVVVFYLEI